MILLQVFYQEWDRNPTWNLSFDIFQDSSPVRMMEQMRRSRKDENIWGKTAQAEIFMKE